jgi:HSP20 family protein
MLTFERESEVCIMGMMSRWDPFAEISRLQDQLSRQWHGEGRTAAFAPAVDIYEDDGSIMVQAELPGIKAEDLKINVENNVLTLSGERKLEHEDKREGYHRIERAYGAFTRSFVLPESVDAEKVEAEVNEGVLTIKIPKKPEVEPKRIEVKSKAPTTPKQVEQKQVEPKKPAAS